MDFWMRIIMKSLWIAYAFLIRAALLFSGKVRRESSRELDYTVHRSALRCVRVAVRRRGAGRYPADPTEAFWTACAGKPNSRHGTWVLEWHFSFRSAL
jgi:hypothetical protein